MRTEQISPRYVELDSWPTDEILAAIYEGHCERQQRYSEAGGSSTLALVPLAASRSRMARSCRQPLTGPPIVLCLLWQEGSMRWSGVPSRPRITRPPVRKP